MASILVRLSGACLLAWAIPLAACSDAANTAAAGGAGGPSDPSGLSSADSSIGSGGSGGYGAWVDGGASAGAIPIADAGSGGTGGATTDAGATALPQGTDATVTPSDTTLPDDDTPKVGIGERPDAFCGYGSILGLVCSPSQQVFVNGATVTLDAVDCDGVTPLHFETLTDADGNYQLTGIPSGYQTVHVQKDDYEDDYSVLVKAGKTTDISGFGYKQCFKYVDACQTGKILGAVCEGEGDLVVDPAKVTVSTYDCDLQPITIETMSGADGTYVLDGVPEGMVWVFVELGNESIQYQVEVKAGEVTKLDPWLDASICFPKEPCPFGSLTGKLCVPEGNAWIAGAKVWVQTADCDGNPVYAEAQSDADGVFWLGGVPAGPGWLHVTYEGTGYQVQVTVVKGTTIDVGVVGADSCNPKGQCGYGAVTGYVCAPSGVKVTGAQVKVKAVDCNGQPVLLSDMSDGDGNFIIPNVPSGTVTVVVTKGDFSVTYTVQVNDGQVTDAANIVEDICFPDKQVKLAVVTGNWDMIEDILSKLGLSYDLYDGKFNTSQAIGLLTNLGKMNEYDVIFFDCGAEHFDIVAGNPLIQQNLQAYVQAGNSIYASDWAFVYAEFPWPQAIDFYGADNADYGPKVGNAGTITGTVVDVNLQNYLGKANVTINYDLSMWVVVQAAAGTTGVHIVGNVPQAGGSVPLMMSHAPYGGTGRVLYTTFHNEFQVTGDMKQILYYLVFEL